MSRNVELEERMLAFAVDCIKVCELLPSARIGATNLGLQLFRSSTSVAANYAEASQAESAQDFIHKLKIVLKELNESRTWLRIATDGCYVTNSTVATAIRESKELSRILSASVSTLRRRQSKKGEITRQSPTSPTSHIPYTSHIPPTSHISHTPHISPTFPTLTKKEPKS